ncbi:MAG: hypothetical protein JWO00_619 [Candidatus Parcubacteria bacterium]|nr:hypothetical protein [Candidatus Parcubacteria bacterium]
MPANTPDLKMIQKVLNLRKRGKTYRAIANELKRDVKTIYRWANLYTERLSEELSPK